MLNLLSLWLLVATLIQLLFVLNGRYNPYTNDFYSASDPVLWISVILLLGVHFLYYITSKKYDKTSLIEKINFEAKWYYLFVFLIFIISFFCISKLPSFDEAMTLNGSQQVQGVGLIFKSGTTLLPALVFSLVTLYPRKTLSYFLLFYVLIISSVIGAAFLSKQPFLPYILFLAVLYKSNNIKIKVIVFILMSLLIFSLVFVYTKRGEDASFLNILDKVIFRFILLQETQKIINFIYENGALFIFDIKTLMSSITSIIFEHDSNVIGVAPGYIGFFVSNFNIFGLFLLIIFTIWINIIINGLRAPLFYDRFVYYLVVCELLSFFVDGNPSIITSTSNNILFYVIMLMIIGVYTKNNFLKNQNVNV